MTQRGRLTPVALFVTVFGALPTAFWLLNRHALTLVQALLFGVRFANVPVVVGTGQCEGE